MTDEEGLLFDRFGEIIADASDVIDAMISTQISISTIKKNFEYDSEDDNGRETMRGVAERARSMKARVKALAKEYLTLRAAASKAKREEESSGGGEQLRDALLQARADAAERENAKLKMALKEAKEDCALLVRAARMAREEFTRLDKLEEEEDEEGDEDDDAVTVKSLASSGGATYGSGVQTLFNAQDEDEEDEEDDDDDGRGRGRNETQSLHDILDLDDQYNAALEKLRTANISSSAAASVANDNDDSTHNNSLAASIARKNAAQNKDEVTETAKAAAMFAATAALYSHSGLNAVPNSGGKNTNKSSTSEVSSGTTSKSGGQTPAAALCVDDESDQGQVFRTPVLVVSDHPDALSSSDEDKELDGEGSMQNALDRVFFGDDDEDEVDSPSGFGTTTTKKRGENKMSFFNALPP